MKKEKSECLNKLKENEIIIKNFVTEKAELNKAISNYQDTLKTFEDRLDKLGLNKNNIGSDKNSEVDSIIKKLVETEKIGRAHV